MRILDKPPCPSLCSVPHPSTPIISSLLSLPASSLLTLHPDCVCMNIDVNYPSPENSCSVCDFPKECETHTHRHTHKGGCHRGEYLLCSGTGAYIQGVVSVELHLFYPRQFFPSNAAPQYGTSFMPK